MKDNLHARTRRFLLLLATCSVSLIASAGGDDSATGRLEQGFSTARLAALNAEIRKDVSSARLPGGVILIARDGKLVHAQAFGVQDPRTPVAMPQDAIFRIYSMTKPFVSVAAMTMVEEGKLLLTDPVSKHLPELKNLRVGVERTDGEGKKVLDLVAATREMTIHDLLRHTAGLTYGFEGTSLVKDEYKKYRIDGAELTEADWIARLSVLPLQSQPGSRWEYSIATDVLGVLLERVSGKTLEALLTERLFGPLGMKDTAFSVAAAKQSRIAQPFEIDPIFKVKFAMTDFSKPVARFSGGGGAVSTAGDYLRFAQMLLNRGELDGVRILSPKTIDYMLSDHLLGLRASTPPGNAAPGPRPGYGFGLGFAIRNDIGVANTLGSVGIADWSGLGGTHFWIDPKEKLAVIWMAQAAGLRAHYRQLIPNMVYGAMLR